MGRCAGARATSRRWREDGFLLQRIFRFWPRTVVRYRAAKGLLSGRTRHWAAEASTAARDPTRTLANISCCSSEAGSAHIKAVV
jgi:hypothetical protein